MLIAVKEAIPCTYLTFAIEFDAWDESRISSVSVVPPFLLDYVVDADSVLVGIEK